MRMTMICWFIAAFAASFIQGQPEPVGLEAVRKFQEIVHKTRQRIVIPADQKHPRDLRDASLWLKEAYYTEDMGHIFYWHDRKPPSVWRPFYERAIKLAHAVFEKFGNVHVLWLIPEDPYGKYGMVILTEEEVQKEYQREDIYTSHGPDPTLPYRQLLERIALLDAKEQGIDFLKVPLPKVAVATPLDILHFSYRRLGNWQGALWAVEEIMKRLPCFSLYLFDKWLEYAEKVYRQGALPTKWLLLVRLPQHSGGLPTGVSKPGPRRFTEYSSFIGMPLTFLEGQAYVELCRLDLLPHWKVNHKDNSVTIEAQGKSFTFTVNQSGLQEREGKLLLSVAQLAQMLDGLLVERKDIGSLLLSTSK